MATLLIAPIEEKSVGGYPVIITGIAPTDHDCIVGKITTPGQQTTGARWNLSGIMRDGTDLCNIDLNSDDLLQVANLAKKLGAE